MGLLIRLRSALLTAYYLPAYTLLLVISLLMAKLISDVVERFLPFQYALPLSAAVAFTICSLIFIECICRFAIHGNLRSKRDLRLGDLLFGRAFELPMLNARGQQRIYAIFALASIGSAMLLAILFGPSKVSNPEDSERVFRTVSALFIGNLIYAAVLFAMMIQNHALAKKEAGAGGGRVRYPDEYRKKLVAVVAYVLSWTTLLTFILPRTTSGGEISTNVFIGGFIVIGAAFFISFVPLLKWLTRD